MVHSALLQTNVFENASCSMFKHILFICMCCAIALVASIMCSSCSSFSVGIKSFGVVTSHPDHFTSTLNEYWSLISGKSL